MAREDQGTEIPKGVVDRVVEGLRYIATGKPPSDGGRGKLETSFFGPQEPLKELAPEARSRQFDYPVGYNLSTRPRAYEGITFQQLRNLADSYDLLRLVIETRKDQIESYEWDVVARDGATVADADLDKVTAFFRSPDKEHSWSTWLRMLLEDLFVIDAVTVYPRTTAGGQLYSLELMDGSTIKRVLDATGRTPLPPETAYQQVLKGLPAVNYTREELVYLMRNPRTSRVYGLSPVEQLVMTVNIALRRQVSQLQHFTEGNVPEAFAGLPDSWTVEQVEQFQVYWDSLMEGDHARRRRMRFVPFDPNRIKFTKDPELKDLFDEWLARVVCFAFSISPTMLVKETNRATADTVQETAKQEGLIPLLNWLKSTFDMLIAERLGHPGIEFKWKLQKDLDPLIQAQVDQIYLGSKVITPDEVRERLGMPELTPEQKKELNPPPPPGLNPFEAPGAQPPGKKPTPPFGKDPRSKAQGRDGADLNDQKQQQKGAGE